MESRVAVVVMGLGRWRYYDMMFEDVEYIIQDIMLIDNIEQTLLSGSTGHLFHKLEKSSHYMAKNVTSLMVLMTVSYLHRNCSPLGEAAMI